MKKLFSLIIFTSIFSFTFTKSVFALTALNTSSFNNAFSSITLPILPTLNIPNPRISLPQLVRPTFTPPQLTNTSKNKIKWVTPSVTLEADDFYIMANGRKYSGKDPSIDIDSDPGRPDYTSLEMIWHENGIEMRLFIYFTNDGNNWWSDEFRTYNGLPRGDWIYYYGKFFEGKMGSAYQIDKLDLSSSTGVRYGMQGKIHFENLKIQTFFKPKN